MKRAARDRSKKSRRRRVVVNFANRTRHHENNSHIDPDFKTTPEGFPDSYWGEVGQDEHWGD
jgi:hypothetical protein